MKKHNAGGKITKAIKRKKPAKGNVKVSDLKNSFASYNPRVISDRELKSLKSSYETYGDLSGVVFNIRTSTLISGHQRIKTIHDKRTKIEKHKHIDSYGTVAVGNILVQEADGSVMKIPYREVNWNDAKAEMAANIAANAGGGHFDNDKLSAMLEELDLTDNFLVETLGLDPLSLKQLSNLDRSDKQSKNSGDDTKPKFDEYDENSFEFEHQCPKCKYKW